MRRVLRLIDEFYESRRMHAPPTSPADVAVRRALRQLASDRYPIPGHDDREDLRTPIGAVFSRRVVGTELAILYRLELPIVHVLALKPAAW